MTLEDFCKSLIQHSDEDNEYNFIDLEDIIINMK